MKPAKCPAGRTTKLIEDHDFGNEGFGTDPVHEAASTSDGGEIFVHVTLIIWFVIALRKPVCTENVVRIDLATESHDHLG